MPTNITSPVESLQPTAIDPLHISSNSKLIYCNGQGGFTKVPFTDLDLEIIFREASGTPGTNVLKQFESILANLPGVDSWYINLINGIIYIHTQDYNDTPVGKYIFKNEPGELLEVQIKLQNKHTDPTDKVINSVQSMLSSFAANQRANQLAAFRAADEDLFSDNTDPYKLSSLTGYTDFDKELYFTKNPRTRKNGKVVSGTGKQESIKVGDFAILAVSNDLEEKSRAKYIYSRLTAESFKLWQAYNPRTIEGTNQIGVLTLARKLQRKKEKVASQIYDIKDKEGNQDINKGYLKLNRDLFRNWALSHPREGKQKCFEALKSVNLNVETAIQNPTKKIQIYFSSKELEDSYTFWGAYDFTFEWSPGTVMYPTSYGINYGDEIFTDSKNKERENNLKRKALPALQEKLKTVLGRDTYELILNAAKSKDITAFFLEHMSIKLKGQNTAMPDMGSNPGNIYYDVTFHFIADQKDNGIIVVTAGDIIDIWGQLSPQLGDLIKSYQGGNSKPSLRNTALRKKRETELVANVTVVGRPSLISGKDIEIHNIGKKYSGVWFIRRCIHTINPSQGYLTKMELVLKRTFG